MAALDLAIRGGTVVTAADIFRADIGVQAGRIVTVSDARRRGRAGDRRLRSPRAAGRHRQPCPYRAAGRPRHRHGRRLRLRHGGGRGGRQHLRDAVRHADPRHLACAPASRNTAAKAEGECLIDVAFHLIISDPSPEVLGQELPALLKAGYTSFKVFMTYDDLVLNDRELLEVFDVARRERALVMVHAEGYDAIKFMTERLEREGYTAPYYHAVSRPEIVEREAAHRAISHAQLVDVPIMIVHVSGREAMEQIRWAQSRGLKIYAETCPQYITLTAESLQGPEHGHERRQIRVLAAAPRRREPGRHLGGLEVRACSRPSRRTIARSATTARRAS